MSQSPREGVSDTNVPMDMNSDAINVEQAQQSPQKDRRSRSNSPRTRDSRSRSRSPRRSPSPRRDRKDDRGGRDNTSTSLYIRNMYHRTRKNTLHDAFCK